MLHQPIDELLGDKAVGVRSKMVPPILDHLRLVEPQPDNKQRRQKNKKFWFVLMGGWV